MTTRERIILGLLYLGLGLCVAGIVLAYPLAVWVDSWSWTP